jgi:dihydropteroate synthase
VAKAVTPGVDSGSRATRLVATGRRIEIGGAPLLMGILNATPDSFSDAGLYPTFAARVERGRQLIDDGADILDIGGESAVTHKPAVEVGEEIERVVPLVAELATHSEALISVDTYKPPVASAAIAAGASIVNDISGLRDPELADVCEETGAALVVMHNRGAPKQRLTDPHLYTDVVADVLSFLRERVKLAEDRGVAGDGIIVDPGPDFSKTPTQTVEVLRHLDALVRLGYPVLMPISRKDFIGALLQQKPRARLAGTLAALDHGLASGAHIFRVHDVAEARAFLSARRVLSSRERTL